MLGMRILDFKPVSEQRALAHDRIIVDLVAPSDHDVERSALMAI